MSRIIPPPIAVMTPSRIAGMIAKPASRVLIAPVALQQPSTMPSAMTRRTDHAREFMWKAIAMSAPRIANHK